MPVMIPSSDDSERFIKLPTDCNGNPWNIGDEFRNLARNCETGVIEEMSYSRQGWFFVEHPDDPGVMLRYIPVSAIDRPDKGAKPHRRTAKEVAGIIMDRADAMEEPGGAWYPSVRELRDWAKWIMEAEDDR